MQASKPISGDGRHITNTVATTTRLHPSFGVPARDSTATPAVVQPGDGNVRGAVPVHAVARGARLSAASRQRGVAVGRAVLPAKREEGGRQGQLADGEWNLNPREKTCTTTCQHRQAAAKVCGQPGVCHHAPEQHGAQWGCSTRVPAAVARRDSAAVLGRALLQVLLRDTSSGIRIAHELETQARVRRRCTHTKHTRAARMGHGGGNAS
jgi:hypothetical protein